MQDSWLNRLQEIIKHCKLSAYWDLLSEFAMIRIHALVAHMYT